MEIYLHIGISAIGLAILFFLLPVRWTSLGKVVIWFTSSLVGTLFTLAWNLQPTIKTILLHILLAITLSYLIVRRGTALFELPKDESKVDTSTQVEPLYNYHAQLEKAKMAKPANIVETEVHTNSVREEQTEIVSQEIFESVQPDVTALSKLEALTKEEQTFILDGLDFEEEQEEIGHSDEVSVVDHDPLTDMVEDEPGYLLDDWIMEDAMHNDIKEEQPEEVVAQESILTHSENVISFDEKRKEKRSMSSLNSIEELDWTLPEETTTNESQDENAFQLEEKIEQPLNLADNDVTKKEVITSASEQKEEVVDLMDEHANEDSLEKYESVIDGRALLLNDGLANLYKERAESIKKLKSKDEHADSTLKEQKQFLQELSSWFRASND
ncbi:hypothetical protein GCM10008967_25790 [Bacillus carboniphilus]|uniref:MFS transporter n=1 Tax=Bacillus carboniphilus TaxID=86663 RepID=A0ABP3G5M7_9BACI